MSGSSDSSHFMAHKELLESLECPICANIFVEPKQLGCGHTFCQTCVNKLIQKTANTILAGSSYRSALTLTIQCPQCRDVYKIPEGGLSTNFIVKDMVQALKGLEIDEQNNTIPCFYCAKKTPKVETFLCNTCVTDQPPDESSSRNAAKAYMCSVCAIKLHNGHGIALCEDFATQEKRDESSMVIQRSNRIANAYAQGFRNSANALYENMSDVFRDLSHILTKKLDQFDMLNTECYQVNRTPMNEDLAQLVAQAGVLEQRSLSVSAEMNLLKTEFEQKLHVFLAKVRNVLDGEAPNDPSQAAQAAIALPSTSQGPSSSQGSTPRNAFLFDIFDGFEPRNSSSIKKSRRRPALPHMRVAQRRIKIESPESPPPSP